LGVVLRDFAKIKAVFLAVDGVLTDGTVMVTEQGDELRTFFAKDAYAAQLAARAGIRLFVVVSSGRNLPPSLIRAGVREVFCNISGRLATVEKITEEQNLSWDEVLYMGADLPDLPCMQHAGLPVCPGDAAEEVKQSARYISPKNGGKGCVRDVLEKILKLQGKWDLDNMDTEAREC